MTNQADQTKSSDAFLAAMQQAMSEWGKTVRDAPANPQFSAWLEQVKTQWAEPSPAVRELKSQVTRLEMQLAQAEARLRRLEGDLSACNRHAAGTD